MFFWGVMSDLCKEKCRLDWGNTDTSWLQWAPTANCREGDLGSLLVEVRWGCRLFDSLNCQAQNHKIVLAYRVELARECMFVALGVPVKGRISIN
jgi:hypothetical protein